jgi:hypothetical protein
VLVAQKDYLSRFVDSQDARVEWFPLWASKEVELQPEKLYEAVFVGTMNRDLNPARVDFFERLTKIAPLQLFSGDYAGYFPFSKVVVNQTVKGDLNFRVFEALRCGALLITEEQGNGLSELFKKGEQLLLYKAGQVEEAAHLIKQSLALEGISQKIAFSGYQEVMKKHRSYHRSIYLADLLLEGLSRPPKRRSRLPMMANSAVLAAHLENRLPNYAKLVFAESLKLLIKGLSEAEELTEELAVFAIMAAFGIRRLEPESPLGGKIITLLSDLYPNLQAIGISKLADLNRTYDPNSPAGKEIASLIAQCLGGSEEQLKLLEYIYRRAYS